MKTGSDTSERAFASLRFIGDSLDPDSLSQILGTEPTLSYRKGDIYEVGRRKNKGIRSFGLWLFDTDKVISDGNLKSHLVRISAILTNNTSSSWNDDKFEIVNKFIRSNKIGVDIGLFWRGPPSLQPVVPIEFIEAICILGGKIESDISPRTSSEERQAQIFA